jgi:predicted transcriptional regulator
MARAATPRAAPRKRKSNELIVTLDEFAALCGVTPETMRNHLKQAPAEADWLLARGGRGRGYKIAAEAALAWYRQRSAGDGVDSVRQARLAELRLQMLGDAGDDDGLLLTGKQRHDEYRAGQAELDYREAIGELCRVAEIEDETVNAVIELRRQLQGVGPTIRRKFGLDREVEISIDELIAEKLVAFVKVLDADVEPLDG